MKQVKKVKKATQVILSLAMVVLITGMAGFFQYGS